MSEHDYRKIFCNNLKCLRRTKGLSKKEMSQILNISEKSISMLESGIIPQRLSASVIFRIGKAWGIAPEYMFVEDYFEIKNKEGG